MSAIRWARKGGRLSSWHLVDETLENFDTLNGTTLCGRRPRGMVIVEREMPGDARTCERCAVIATKRDA